MSKKISIKVKDVDKLEFYINESAQPNDYFSLNEVNEIDFSEIKKIIDQEKDEIVKNKIKEEEKNWLNKFKNSDEYISLLKKNNSLENQINILNNEKNHIEKSAIEKTRNDYFEKIKNLEFEIQKLQNEKSNLINTNSNKVNELEKIFELKLDVEKRKLVDFYKEEIGKLKDSYQEEKGKLESTIQDLLRNKSTNSKVIGEELENWILNKYNETLGLTGDCEFEKTTKDIEGTKPDFLFKVIDPTTKTELVKVMIEAKSEGMDGTKSKTKNSQHFERLEINRRKWNADYAILVTELEKEETFSIKKINNTANKNSFLARPEYFTVLLSIIRLLYIEKIKIIKSGENLKDKQELIDEFEKMKAEILNNSIKNISTNLDNILKESDTIFKAAEKIRNNASTALNSHINTIENKINNFKIQKISKVLDKIKNNEE